MIRVRLEGGPADGQDVEVREDLEWVQWTDPAPPMPAPRKTILTRRATAHVPVHRYRRDPARPMVYVHVPLYRRSTK